MLTPGLFSDMLEIISPENHSDDRKEMVVCGDEID